MIFAATAVVGLALTAWACVHNPAGAAAVPGPLPPGVARITTGPYRWLRHPMYDGQLLLAIGLAGLAAGWWNAAAVGYAVGMVLTEWKLREEAR